MMDLLQFTFQSFWHFVGVAILLGIVMSPLAALAGGLGAKLGRR